MLLGREIGLASRVSAESVPRHRSLPKIVITMQSLIILSLSLWIVEEYLNNMYLREYVSGVFQTDGLMIGLLGTFLVIGSISSLVFAKRRHGEKRFGAVSLDVTSSASKIKLATGAITRPTEAIAKPSEASAKPSMDFHPVVAALKADMANRRTSFGSMLGSSSEQPSTGPVRSLEIPKTSVLEQLAPNRPVPVTGPRPGQNVPTLPRQPLQSFRPQPPTSPKVDQPGGSLAQRFLPAPRPQQPAGSNVLQSSPSLAPQIPANVTTVITGILPVQKKKDPTDTTEEKPASSQ